jgi:hypothetical protein
MQGLGVHQPVLLHTVQALQQPDPLLLLHFQLLRSLLKLILQLLSGPSTCGVCQHSSVTGVALGAAHCCRRWCSSAFQRSCAHALATALRLILAATLALLLLLLLLKLQLCSRQLLSERPDRVRLVLQRAV